MGESYKVYVHSDSLKFTAAHFIAYKGYREKLHGHNYTVSLIIKGKVNDDGYVLDFTELKQIENGDNQIKITTEDKSFFSFPLSDCWLAKIVHSSAEEIAKLLLHDFIKTITLEKLKSRGVVSIVMIVAEAPTQEARYKYKL